MAYLKQTKNNSGFTPTNFSKFMLKIVGKSKPTLPKKAVKLSQKSLGGFSMIEIPIGLFIIGLVLLIYATASNTVVLNGNAKRQELAHRIATSKLEDLRATAFGSLPASGSFTNPLLSSLPSGSANLTVADVNDDTKQITVTVSWKEPGNSNTRNVTLVTLITQNGI